MYLYVQPSLTSKILLNVNFYSFQLQRSRQTPTSTFSNFTFFNFPVFVELQLLPTPNFEDQTKLQLLLFSTSTIVMRPNFYFFQLSRSCWTPNFYFFQLQRSHRTPTSHFSNFRLYAKPKLPTFSNF